MDYLKSMLNNFYRKSSVRLTIKSLEHIPIPLWIIIVAAAGALLLLLIIAIICWRCGVFGKDEDEVSGMPMEKVYYVACHNESKAGLIVPSLISIQSPIMKLSSFALKGIYKMAWITAPTSLGACSKGPTWKYLSFF